MVKFDGMDWLNRNCPSNGGNVWGCPTCHYYTHPTAEELAKGISKNGIINACVYGHCRIGEMERDGKIYG